MHRIDTPTAQKDKWGAGKNGYTDGDPSTGVKSTALNAAIFDSLQEEICNAIEKSGLELDPNDNTQLYKVLSAIGTAIGNYLKIENNLSEIAGNGTNAQSAARGNLGLKSAATHDVTASHTDGAAEHVLRVADFGVGGYGTDTMLTVDTVRKPLRNGFYGVSADPTYGNAGLISFGYDSGSQTQILAKQGGQTPRLAICGSNPQGVFGNWGKIFTEFEPPTAIETKALPLSGGEMSGTITVDPDAGSGSYASQNDSNVLAPIFQLIDSESTSKFFPIVKQRYSQGNGTWALGTIIEAGNFQVIYFSESDPDGKTFNFDKSGQFLPPNYGNFDVRYISNLQLGAQVAVARNDDTGENKAAAGYVVSGSYSSYQDSNWEMDQLYCKPLQKYINGAWVTISG